MTMGTFVSLTNKKIIQEIFQASRSVLYLSPGISKEIAETLVLRKELEVDVIVDEDPEICRIGYGDIEGIEVLINSQIVIRKANCLRIGVLVIDEKAWIFCPTPLIVEAEPSNLTINAISVTFEQASQLIYSISPNINEDQLQQLSLFSIAPEIAEQKYTKSDYIQSKQNLDHSPPRRFDFERRVRTYNSFVQFVELSLKGIYLNRRTISIPTKLLNVNNSKEVEERLRTTYKLIDEKSKVSSKQLEERVTQLRRKYLRSMGNRLGSVILRNIKDEFLRELKEFEKDIQKFTEGIKERLSKSLQKTKNELIEVLLTSILTNPPDELITGITTKKPSKDVARKYLDKEIEKVIPDIDEFLSEMKLYCDFKDITYEMLTDKEFQSKLREQYPYVDWPVPYEEKEAVQVLLF